LGFQFIQKLPSLSTTFRGLSPVNTVSQFGYTQSADDDGYVTDGRANYSEPVWSFEAGAFGSD
jgi:hypothetical protein